LLVTVRFLDGFDAAELQHRLTASFDGRQASSKIVCRLHGDVFFDFGPQEFLVRRRGCP
jgi:hypothetical protein